MLKVLDLFSGIGGFSLGLERTGGFKTVAFCEIEKYPQKVLAKHWPGVPIYEDVRELTAKQLIRDGIRPTVITGGFPCQDISVAGNQKGIGEGTRSGLWSECSRLLRDIRPKYAIFENVTALISGESGRWFEQVLWDISAVGYDAEWHCIPASQLGAHHHRDRIWIICYPKRIGRKAISNRKGNKSKDWERIRPESSPAGSEENVAHTNSAQCQRNCSSLGILTEHANLGGTSRWKSEPDVGRVANGIPARPHRLKGLGNAVVPQIPELIGRAILEAENKNMLNADHCS